MKLIIDDKIPYIRQAIGQLTDDAVFVPGNQFTPGLVKDANALIIRTRTRCNRELLEGSSVQLIATATIGYDHIDTDYCRQAGICWTNAPGCNASSVVQYVESCLLLLQRERSLRLEGARIGVVGTGNVGSRVAAMAEKYKMVVLRNDPPLQDRNPGTANEYCTLEEIARTCDVITFHTPLNRDGKYKSLHLAGEAFFSMINPASPAVVINTSRGEVVDTHALIRAMDAGRVREAILDVWEGEPNVNIDLLKRSFIGTPHIAGYSADGKANATRMSLEALCRHFHLDVGFEITPPAPACKEITAHSEAEALLKIYDPRMDSLKLKKQPELFEWFRGNYPLRRERSAFSITLG